MKNSILSALFDVSQVQSKHCALGNNAMVCVVLAKLTGEATQNGAKFSHHFIARLHKTIKIYTKIESANQTSP